MRSPIAQLIFTSTICLLLIGGYVVWYSVVEKKSTAVAELEGQIAAKTETSNRIAAARASLTEIANNEKDLLDYFVAETEVVDFIDSLESIGRAQKATVHVLSVSKSTTPGQPALQFSLEVSGAFDAVMRTVGAIEYAPYNLLVSGLSVAKDEESSWRATLSVVVGSLAASSTPHKP